MHLAASSVGLWCYCAAQYAFSEVCMDLHFFSVTGKCHFCLPFVRRVWVLTSFKGAVYAKKSKLNYCLSLLCWKLQTIIIAFI